MRRARCRQFDLANLNANLAHPIRRRCASSVASSAGNIDSIRSSCVAIVSGVPTVVTIEFHERGAETELVLTHRRLPPAVVDSHRQGWTDIVRLLDEALTSGR